MRLASIFLALLLVSPVWGLAYVVAGWLGVGIVLMSSGAGFLLIAFLSWISRPPNLRPIREEPVATHLRNGKLRLTRATWKRQVRYRAMQRRAA